MTLWFGKVVGGFFGLSTGGPAGFVMGLIIGHILDQAFKNAISPESRDSAQPDSVPELFFKGTFLAMGQLAKADGRVSESEIQAATHVMNQMGLQGDNRMRAIEYFNQGKQRDIDTDLHALQTVFVSRSNLAVMFIEIQLSVAYADGNLSASEMLVLKRMCKAVGISAMQFSWIHNRMKAAHSSGGQRARKNSQSELKNAYAVLGVDESIGDDELKKAYRKLMSQHHPDKLLSKGLPEQMIQLAKEKTQQIQSAYDVVKKHRK